MKGSKKARTKRHFPPNLTLQVKRLKIHVTRSGSLLADITKNLNFWTDLYYTKTEKISHKEQELYLKQSIIFSLSSNMIRMFRKQKLSPDEHRVLQQSYISLRAHTGPSKATPNPTHTQENPSPGDKLRNSSDPISPAHPTSRQRARGESNQNILREKEKLEHDLDQYQNKIASLSHKLDLKIFLFRDASEALSLIDEQLTHINPIFETLFSIHKALIRKCRDPSVSIDAPIDHLNAHEKLHDDHSNFQHDPGPVIRRPLLRMKTPIQRHPQNPYKACVFTPIQQVLRGRTITPPLNQQKGIGMYS